MVVGVAGYYGFRNAGDEAILEAIARELKAQAEREAELLRKEAQAAKERLLQEAAQELKRLRAEIERARQEKALFLGQVRALFEGYLEALKRLEKTP